MLLTSGSKEGGSLWRCGRQILNRAPATFSAGQAARSWASAYHVDREKGIGWRETMRARGWQESPGHWLVSTPTAPATVPQTPHLTHRSEGVKLFIKAHEQVCAGHRLLDKGE